MEVHSIAVHYDNWDDNRVEIEVWTKPATAESGTVNYEFYNVTESILESIREWATQQSNPSVGEGFITPLDRGWAWHSIHCVVA